MQRVIRSIFVLFLLGFFTGTSAQLPPKVIADKYLTLASGKLDSIETSLDSIKTSYERIFNRALRQNITDMQGNVIMVGGQPVTELNPDSEILFRDDNLTAYSFKFIFFY